MRLTFHKVGGHQEVHQSGSVAVTHQSQIVAIASEARDAVVDPLQRRLDVEKSVVPHCISTFAREKT